MKEVFGDYSRECSPEARIKVILQGQEKESFVALGAAAREYSQRWDVTTIMPRWEQLLAD